MNKRFGLRYKCVLGVGVLLSLATGCASRLPGPLQCEQMAAAWLGKSPEAISVSPAAERLSAKLVDACLTVPFDLTTVRCMEESRHLRGCVENLADREPSRTPALRQLLDDLGTTR